MGETSIEKSPEETREGCIYVRPGLKVAALDGKGRGLISDVDLTPGEVLIIEESVFARKDAAERFRRCRLRLMPRRSGNAEGASFVEGPSLVLGLPVSLVLKWCPPMANLLKIHLNGWWHGLFDLGSVLNHSCGPNCQRVIWKNGVSVVVAAEAITAGSELTVTYGWSEDVMPWRRLRLIEKYGFFCRCIRCRSGAPAKTVFAAAQAEVLSNCEKEGLDKSGLSAQAVTLFELASDDRGGNEPPRLFARAFVRCQLMLESDEKEDAALVLQDVRTLAPLVGCDPEKVAGVCIRSEEEITFAAAIGPMAEAVMLLNLTRGCALVSVVAACGMLSHIMGEEYESYEPIVCLCSAFAVAGAIAGARCYRHGPFSSAKWNCAAGSAAIAALGMACAVEDGPSPFTIAAALVLGGLFARASAISAMRLARYDQYLNSLAKGGPEIGTRFVR